MGISDPSCVSCILDTLPVYVFEEEVDRDLIMEKCSEKVVIAFPSVEYQNLSNFITIVTMFLVALRTNICTDK